MAFGQDMIREEYRGYRIQVRKTGRGYCGQAWPLDGSHNGFSGNWFKGTGAKAKAHDCIRARVDEMVARWGEPKINEA